MMYVATQPLNLGNEIRQPGDLVPEAAFWPTVSAYVATGQLTYIPDELFTLAERITILEEQVQALHTALGMTEKNPDAPDEEEGNGTPGPEPEPEPEPAEEPAPQARSRKR